MVNDRIIYILKKKMSKTVILSCLKTVVSTVLRDEGRHSFNELKYETAKLPFFINIKNFFFLTMKQSL